MQAILHGYAERCKSIIRGLFAIGNVARATPSFSHTGMELGS
jgi:hypothetical protein